LIFKSIKDNPNKLFLETPCFVTEKFDGTNIAKDDLGQIYSRRFPLEEGQDTFIKTSLKKVKDANIVMFRDMLIEAGGLDAEGIKKCVVYGEFICNAFYDYSARGIIGDWKVFGAKLEVKIEGVVTGKKLAEAGFAVPNHTSNPNQVRIFPNEKFFELAKQAKLDVPNIKSKNENIAKVVAMNKEDMRKGLVEGLIMTICQEETGFKVIKWKGTQEFQPHAHANFLEANIKIQKSESEDVVKKAFLDITEVIKDTSENKLAQRLMKKTGALPDKEKKVKKDKKVETKNGKYLTALDKEIILQGIHHSQKKFDSVEEYQKRGEKATDEYTTNLIQEVRKHLAEENTNFVDIDNDNSVMGFIGYKVKSVIKTQLADINESSEN
jgi:hypothetical protein